MNERKSMTNKEIHHWKLVEGAKETTTESAPFVFQGNQLKLRKEIIFFIDKLKLSYYRNDKVRK